MTSFIRILGLFAIPAFAFSSFGATNAFAQAELANPPASTRLGGAAPAAPPPGTAAPSGTLHVNGPIFVPPIVVNGGFKLPPPVTNGFVNPQTITPPFGVEIVGHPPAVTHTSTYNANGPTLTALNPSVIFNFPITPDVNAYSASVGGLHYAYKAIGWVGDVYVEACLTAAEAPAWPGAVPEASDTTTCPSKADTATQTFTPRTWYQVADAKADLYVVQNSGFVFIPVQVSLSIQQIVTPLRFHTHGYEYDYTNNHTGPNDYNAVCPNNAPACVPTLRDTYTPPFNMVVAPAALMQVKVLPETIVYMPPGDKSNANFTVTKTFSTTITAGETTEIDNGSVQDDWMELVDQGGFTGDIGKVLDLGFNGTTDTRWDTKTTLKAGQAAERDLQGLNQVATMFTRKITADPTTVPGASGAFNKEPFWSDLIVVLVHPQFAVWDFYGKSSVQLFAASSTSGLPDDVAIPIGELDACANGAAPYAAGYTFTTATEQPETLTAAECKALAGLDPFYAKDGQSADLDGRGQLMVPSQEYGIPVTGSGSENSLDIKVITSSAETVTDQNTSTYSSTVEDILATTFSEGITFGLNTGSVFSPFSFGLSDSVTLKPGSSTDTSLTMNLTYKNSSATTDRTDVQTEGVVDDGTNRGYSPHVEVYQDDTFGSLMFRDPDAACSPMPDCRTAAPAGPSSQVPHKTSPISFPPIVLQKPVNAAK